MRRCKKKRRKRGCCCSVKPAKQTKQREREFEMSCSDDDPGREGNGREGKGMGYKGKTGMKQKGRKEERKEGTG